MGMTEKNVPLQMQFDPESGAGYVHLSNQPLAYSIDLDDAVIADYDNQGEVVGVEFLDGKVNSVEIERYVNLAKIKTKGFATGNLPRIPSI